MAKPPSLPGRLWAQAYDAIRRDDPKLAMSYETVLRIKLGGESNPARNDEGSDQTDGEQSRDRMVHLVAAFLRKTEREATVKHKIHERIRIVSSAKDLVGAAVKHAPEAASAWAGVCLLLQVLENPTAEAGAHRDGVSYVISRMDWYWKLSTILENQQIADGLQAELEKHVVTLYQKLLSYQMKTVCSLTRQRAAVVWRDMFRFDNWTDALQSIKDTEAVVQQDIDTYIGLGMGISLRALERGSKNQEERLQDERDRTCLADLHLSDPRVDKRRIEATKGGLFRGASNWILTHDDFRRWQHCGDARLLWIKGDPGKGKTMLLITIVDELERRLAQSEQQPPSNTTALSYFFCQGTNKDLNNATAVLRGLVYLLAVQHPPLVSHLRESYDHAGSRLFDREDSFFALSKAFEGMLRDKRLIRAYLVIDALDECIAYREELIKLIVYHVAASPRVKWIVSSRNWPEIEQHLKMDGAGMNLSLEISQNAEQVSRAVDAYIDSKIAELQSLEDDQSLGNRVRDILREKANSTFLWVALVVEELQTTSSWDMLEVVEEMPPTLEELYSRMIHRIQKLKRRDTEFCRLVLSAAIVAYRPLHLAELGVLSGLPKEISANVASVRKVVALCGSFLTIQEDNFVYVIHQSAKDYLSDKAATAVFPTGQTDIHRGMLRRSLQAMQETLKRDMYGLHHLGFPIDKLKTPDPDPLAAIRYSCVHWVGHFYDIYTSRCPKDQGVPYCEPVGRFFRQLYLYWLEALSLMRHMGDGVLSITRLEGLLKEQSSDRLLADLVQDSRRFILQNRWVIENAPLQTYGSALIFSPANSLLRKIFEKEEPRWIELKPIVESTWSTCEQTLEGHGDWVWSVAFSPDSKLVASGSDDRTIKLWDTATGVLQQTLEGHSDWVRSVAFSPDSKLVVSGSEDRTIKVWNTATGALQQTLKGHRGGVGSITFSPNSKLVASGSEDLTVKLWDIVTGALQQTLEGHSDSVWSVAFSPDSKLVASGSEDRTIKVWDMSTGALPQTLESHGSSVQSVAFSPDSKLLASGSEDRTVKLWDTATGALQQTLEGHGNWVWSVAFSPDSKVVASGSGDRTIKVWDIATGALQQTLEGHGSSVRSVAFSPNSKLVASGSEDRAIKLWDIATDVFQQTLDGHSDWVRSVAFSPDSKLVASGSDDRTIKLWDTATGALQQTLKGHIGSVWSVAFSPDSKLVASGSEDQTVKLWDTATGALQRTFCMGAAITNLSFDSIGSYLETNVGRLKLADRAEAPSRAPDPDQIHRHGYSLSHDKSWITWNEHNLLWLPPDCRPFTSAISCFATPSTTTVTVIALGCHSGRLVVMGLPALGPYSTLLP